MRPRSSVNATPRSTHICDGHHDEIDEKMHHHHLMPKPSPRKLGKARDLSESPEKPDNAF